MKMRMYKKTYVVYDDDGAVVIITRNKKIALEYARGEHRV